MIAVGAYAAGAMETLELGLLETRFGILDRPASGEIVAVQIDARTIQELGEWPLPRNTYAFAVRALAAAGASEIAIDVDMSARTNINETAALARALEDVGGHVILPAFTQLAKPGVFDGGLIDAKPEPALAPHAWLGSVNVVPDRDGRLRQLIYGMRNADGDFRYSMFALLAGKAKMSLDPFYVDYGIDARTIPRISFVDVMNGRFDVNAVNGKRIIIGGTAVELGDHFSVPRYGVMSGPIVQAMGFETLFQGREIHRTGPVAVVLLVLLVLAACLWMPRDWGWRTRGAWMLSMIVCLLAASVVCHVMALSLDVLPAILAVVISFGAQIALKADAHQLLATQQTRIASHQRILLDRVVADSFDGIAILDENGVVEKANKRTFDLCGVPYTDQQVDLDYLFSNLSFSRDRPPAGWHTVPLAEALVAGQEDGDETRHIEFVLNRTSVPKVHAASGESKFRFVFGLTIRDVTDSVRAVAAQKEAREQAERANRAKTDFLANMSHELRTPLNAVIGFAELMEKQALGPMGNADYVEYAEHISTSGRHLLTIVTDILDVSRIEMGELECVDDEVSLIEIVESAIQVAKGIPELETCQFETDFDPRMPDVVVDSRRIQRAVVNLLSNAGKFSPQGSQIFVRVALSPSGHPMIEIRDQGQGIPVEMLSSILMPFQQVSASLQRTNDGIGMGLTLVSSFMKLHGGDVEIDSEVGRGTTVTLAFPADRVCKDGPVHQGGVSG